MDGAALAARQVAGTQRILLLTDTHGQLGCVNELARATGATAVVHAGDLGFYDDASVDLLSEREVRLHLLHGGLPEDEKRAAIRRSASDQREMVRRAAPLSDLPLYLAGRERFEVPVYAVWGNHEDLEVVRRFRAGEYRVENLFLLDENASYRLGDLHLFGLGGNLLTGKKLFQRPLAGGGGKLWTTLSQYAALWERVTHEAAPGALPVFVSHVSPGKEPVLLRLAAHLGARLVVSGHMGPPCALLWNEFTVRSLEESLAWLAAPVAAIRESWARVQGEKAEGEERRLIEVGLRLLETLPAATRQVGRHGPEPLWYRDVFSVNLPDAAQGHAVLVVEDGRFRLEPRSRGLLLSRARPPAR